MATFEFYIDWLKTGFVHRHARPGDPENVFGREALRMNSVSVVALGPANRVPLSIPDRYSEYGMVRGWRPADATANSYYQIGLGSAYLAATQPAGTYTGVLWVKARQSGISMHLRMLTEAGGDTAGSTVALTMGVWTQITVTATLPAPTRPYLRMRLNAPVAGEDIQVDWAGPMIVAGSTAPSGYNSGGLSRYDNITEFFMGGDWSSGFQQPYRHVADTGHAQLRLDNTDGWFTPENSASPLYGELTPRQRVLIYSYEDPASTERTLMWHGYTKSYKPNALPGEVATCRIECVDLRGLAEGVLARGVWENQTAAQIAEAIAALVTEPEAFFSDWLSETAPSFNPTPVMDSSLVETYAFAPDSAQPDEADVIRLLNDCAGAEQAKIVFNARLITDAFQWRYATQQQGAPLITLNADRLQDVSYVYAESIINDSTVVARKRKTSTATDKILYDIEEAITLTANETQVIRARYKDKNLEDEKTVGGLDVYLEYTAGGGVTATITDEFWGGCEITIVNTKGAERTVSALKVRGKKLTSWGETEHRATNDTTLNQYGTRAELLDFRLPSDQRRAQRVAEYRVSRFGAPQGEIRSVTLKTLHGDDALREAMLTYGLFTPIRIEASAASHAANYVIIGEEHRLDSGNGGQPDGAIGGYTVTWIVEKQYPFAIADDTTYGLLDAGNVLAFY